VYTDIPRDDFARMPPGLRRLHSSSGHLRALGSVTVTHYGSLARMVGCPPAGHDIPVELLVDAYDDHKVWTRHFGSRQRRSVQCASFAHLLD
jgi:hypothetical protein